MMLPAEVIREENKNKNIKELIKKRDELLETIKDYEERKILNPTNKFTDDDLLKPSPQTRYIFNNEYLKEITDLILEKVNKSENENTINKTLKRSELSKVFKDCGLDNISTIIEKIKGLFKEYNFESDDNFIVCGRREHLIVESLGIINNDSVHSNGNLLNDVKQRSRFIIGNIYELTECSAHPYICKNDTITNSSTIHKRKEKDEKYLNNGIVSLEEKNIIEDLILKLEELNKSIY